ncbi:MAG: RDD family protein [Gammaproteobacteria bacterium]
MSQEELEYVGFWPRVGAAIIDSIVIIAVTTPILISIYGWTYYEPGPEAPIIAGPLDFLITWIFPAVAIILFWRYKQATPGKMVISARIVDAETGQPASTGQLIGRYLGYYVSTIPFLLGLIWVAFDRRKQGWHDKLAGTVVVRPRYLALEPAVFRAAQTNDNQQPEP